MPTFNNQSCIASATISGPLSDRINSGVPWRRSGGYSASKTSSAPNLVRTVTAKACRVYAAMPRESQPTLRGVDASVNGLVPKCSFAHATFTCRVVHQLVNFLDSVTPIFPNYEEFLTIISDNGKIIIKLSIFGT